MTTLEKAPDIPWGPVGYVTYKRTYSRRVNDKTSEEWPDTVDRVVSACHKQLGIGFSPEEEQELKDIMLNLKLTEGVFDSFTRKEA